MRRIGFLILNFSFLIFLAGCNPAAKFEVIDVDARLAGLTGVRGEVVVDNAGRRDLRIESAEFTLRVAGRETARAVLVEPILVPARKTSRVDFRLRLTDVSLGALGAIGRANDATVDVDGVARLGRGRKKFHLKKVPISEIIRTFER